MATTAHRKTRPRPTRWLRQGRGSALILTVLLTLILSAMAIVAMRDVARSVHQSGVFRTRIQADLMSESALQVYGKRSGDKANSMLSALRKAGSGVEGGNAGVYGQSIKNSGSGAPTLKERRVAQATEGGHLNISSSTEGVGGTNGFLTGVSGTETGLFLKSDAADDIHSFESQRPSAWRIIIRDPTDGIPAPGFSGRYCFKKVLIASDATVGVNDGDWKQVNNIANRRHAFDSLLGPVECGYQ